MRLLSFSVKNYKSFNEQQEVSFAEDTKNVTAFFGPNSAGKTNLFSALEFYCDFILHSTNFRRQKVLARDFFQYVDENSSLPTEFGAEFKTDKARYKYEFSIERNGCVGTERLQRSKLGDSVVYETIFSRKSMKNNGFSDFGFASTILKETRPDALVLTRAYGANNLISKDVVSGIEKIMPFSMTKFAGYTAERVLEKPELKQQVLNFLQMADLYIQDFTVERNIAYDEMAQAEQQPFNDEALKFLRQFSYEVTTTHTVRDASGKVLGARQMSLARDESSGTGRIFNYAAPIVEALEGGKVLYIDELEVNLHEKECAFIVRLFDSDNMNSAGGQLIINTHNIGLMDELGKNNCYLLGKDRFEATVIGRPQGVRADDKNLAKKYKAGMFNALPRVNI